jgi:hypothetical protein
MRNSTDIFHFSVLFFIQTPTFSPFYGYSHISLLHYLVEYADIHKEVL